MKILWIILGVISIIAGVFALANPMAATLAAEQIAGWGFLIVGVLQVYLAFRADGWGARIWAILVALAFILLGIALLGNPLEGIVTLTVLAGIMFMATGIFRVIMSFSLRGTGAFWLVLLSGLLAIELISNGVSMIALSSVVPDK